MPNISGISSENEVRLDDYIKKVNSELDKYKYEEMSRCGLQKEVAEAMWYTLSAGGKRVRAVLTMEFCRVCGGDTDDALPAACAIEMIHAFSLIHDDLPCMDNDDFRRGKPSCHKAFDEATALLAGDALQNKAFEVISNDKKLSDTVKVKLISCISKAVGVQGMIGGQVIDTNCQAELTTSENLLEMYRMKTGALIAAACEMGCICAKAYDKVDSAEKFGECLGLAFQIVDDILDIIGDEKELGKPIGSDSSNEKNTFAVRCGIQESQKFAEKLTDDAMNALSDFDDNCFLKELSAYLMKRKK